MQAMTPQDKIIADYRKSLGRPYYQSLTWNMKIGPIPIQVEGDEIVFALKIDKSSDSDSGSVLEVRFQAGAWGGGVTTVTYLNGIANGSTDLAQMVVNTHPLYEATQEVVLTINAALTAVIKPGVYYRGFRQVNDSAPDPRWSPDDVIVDDMITVFAPVTMDYSPDA